MTRAARPVGPLLAIAVVLVLLVAGVAAGLAGSPERPRRSGLSVQGTVDGLYPGQVTTIDVTVRNRTSRAVRVSLVTARVRTAPQGCPTSVLRLGAARPDRVLRPGRRAVVPLPVSLDGSAPDACQGVTFPLSLRAVAR